MRVSIVTIGDEIFVEGIQRIGEIGVGATQGGISTNTTVADQFFRTAIFVKL